ncbi:B2 protein [Hibiscus syriacus]|uniref:B2 protein n=1 Tax=Hibiscus syriacus TaxID=106335 RepID=A0A6A3BBF9_HIBSY|nr:B2 protein [Hibiscus syriacus]
MEENLRRHLFGLPPRYRDSVRAITPGLPLFLYNYTTHQLHGVFEAASFGGSNIDPTAWEDKKCPGESRFPLRFVLLQGRSASLLKKTHQTNSPSLRWSKVPA